MEIDLTKQGTQLSQEFLNKIRYYLKRENPDSIVVNIHLATVIQESKEYKTSNNFESTIKETAPKPYLIGTIYDIDCYVNPYMRWDDNRILLQKEVKVTGNTDELI